MLTRVITTAGIAALVTVVGGAPASADDGWGHTDCRQATVPGCELVAGLTPGNGHGQHVGDGQQDATHETQTGTDVQHSGPTCRNVAVDHHPLGGSPQEPGGWFMVLCSPDGKDPDSRGPVWIPASAPSAPPISPAELARRAREQLRLPTPTIAASPTGDQLVNLPTWLWLTDGWRSVSESASVPGVSVTATATPVLVTWSMGDGAAVTCSGAGTPYRSGGDPKASSPDCGHTYRTSSAGRVGQAFPVTATVHWTVSWSGGGQSGTFAGLTTTGHAAFRVAESQALNNGGG